MNIALRGSVGMMQKDPEPPSEAEGVSELRI
jgi:hypothetical protein